MSAASLSTPDCPHRRGDAPTPAKPVRSRVGAFAAAMVSDLSAPELAQFRDRWRAEALAATGAEPPAGEH